MAHPGTVFPRPLEDLGHVLIWCIRGQILSASWWRLPSLQRGFQVEQSQGDCVELWNAATTSQTFYIREEIRAKIFTEPQLLWGRRAEKFQTGLPKKEVTGTGQMVSQFTFWLKLAAVLKIPMTVQLKASVESLWKSQELPILSSLGAMECTFTVTWASKVGT